MQKKHVLIFAVFVLCVGVALYLRHSGFADTFSPAHLRTTILSYGIWAPLAYMGLYVVACIFFFPASPLTLAGGALFGALYGTLYTIIGATLGALAAFSIARYLGQSFMKGGTSSLAKKLHAYDEKIAAHGFITVLFLRFVPLFPFNGMNVALGLTKVSLRDYCVGTFFGIIPGTFVFVYFGNSLASLDIKKIISAIILIIALSLVGIVIKKKYTTTT